MRYQPWITEPDWEKHDPKLTQLQQAPVRLVHLDTLLKSIPKKEGIFTILGPRQVGKSTLLRLIAQKNLGSLAPREVLILEGDAIETWRELFSNLLEFIEGLKTKKFRACILIDEITSIEAWYRALKLLADQGKLKGVLLAVTGSSSASLKEGGEFLPGRRGLHAKTDFLLYPVAYRDLARHLSLEEYMVVGGFPWAVNEYLRLGVLPEYVGEIYWAWLKGEFLKRGKSDKLLRHLVQGLSRRLGTGLSQHKLAREMGISSNETARQYLELLEQCFALHEVFWMDPQKKLLSPRKNRKYYPLDPMLFHLFAAGGSLSGVDPKAALASEIQGKLAELIVCQELYHRKEKEIAYWSLKQEVDFVPAFIEVKYQNRVIPQEFAWFEKSVAAPQKLTVLTKNDHFHLGRVKGLPLREWLVV